MTSLHKRRCSGSNPETVQPGKLLRPVVVLPLTTFDLRPLRFSCSIRGRTIRKPTKVASVCHQMLWGRWGSWTLHSGFDALRAALRSRSGSSSHEPPRATYGYSLASGERPGRAPACPREPLVGVCSVVVEAPLGDVAVHVVKPPGVGLLLADRLRLLGVLDVPGVLAELAPGRRRRIGGLGAGAAGVFPLGLGRQAIDLARLGRQPAAIFHRGVVRHADHRLSLAAMPKVLSV